MLQSHLLLCWHGFCDVSVTLCNVSVTLPKTILYVHPRSDSMDSTELAEAVPIVCDLVVKSQGQKYLDYFVFFQWKVFIAGTMVCSTR